MQAIAETTLPTYQRLEWRGTPVYCSPEIPDWFVPNSQADALLQALQAGESLTQATAALAGGDQEECLFQGERFLNRFQQTARPVYGGRASVLSMQALKECWFHITNRCNLTCTHCMFDSNPGQKEHLTREELGAAVDQARTLGCKVFYFTGGEPFIYKGFLDILRNILVDPQAHVVVLTNGLAFGPVQTQLLAMDTSRLHFQISVDGPEVEHEAIRGPGTFGKLMESVTWLRSQRFNVSLSMFISRANYLKMTDLVDIAANHNVNNIHYLWFFKKGQGLSAEFVEPQEIAEKLLEAYARAQPKGVLIDNIETLKSQVFSLPGTHFDLSNAGWQSLAVGPDGNIYPSAALIYDAEAVAGHLKEGLESVWRESDLLQALRSASLTQSERYLKNPLRFIVGGGDVDHSFVNGGNFVGHDPYVDLYNRIALAVIVEEADRHTDHPFPALKSRMGERLYECGEDMDEVAFTHSNCVLSLANQDGHTLTRTFYTAAAEEPNEEILNPVHYDEREISHVPQASRVRNYGCGSPVFDCDLREGETLVDLGSGTGVECFVAAKKVGPDGKVFGIDMADAMLTLANQSKAKVVENLGYDNVTFHKAFFEASPLASATVDVIISNCVINLSPDKRQTFAEIFRMLKPGGRLVVSDICYDGDIPLSIKYNQRLRGECIGGAFRQEDLFSLLQDMGFESSVIVNRFPYREIEGHQFYSLTYKAFRPGIKETRRVIYRGPHAAIVTDSGQTLYRGVTTEISLDERLDDAILILDEKGHVTNSQTAGACCAPGSS